jgi:hypothetical protein
MAKRRVLVALRPVSPVDRLLAVAEGLCRRMGDELEVLADPAHPELGRVSARLEELGRAGIPGRLTPTASINAARVVDYANRHECVVAVVVGRPKAWATNGGDPWAKLDCPLVAASDLPHLPEEQ